MSLVGKGVRGAMWFNFGLFLALHFAVVVAVTSAVRCGLEFRQNHNHTAPHLIFAVTCVVRCIRYSLNNLKSIYFFKFLAFSTQSKTNFSPLF